MIILQDVGSFLTEGIQTFLRQVAIGEVGTSPKFKDLLHLRFPFFFHRFVGVDVPPFHAHTGNVVELLRVFDDTEASDVDTAETGQLAQLIQVVFHATS